MTNLTTRTFKSRFKKYIGEAQFNELQFKISDQKVNGVFSEATGHIYNPRTNLYVYVNLKYIKPWGYMCRYALGFKDYSSNKAPQGVNPLIMRNRWSKSEDMLYMSIAKMLSTICN